MSEPSKCKTCDERVMPVGKGEYCLICGGPTAIEVSDAELERFRRQFQYHAANH